VSLGEDSEMKRNFQGKFIEAKTFWAPPFYGNAPRSSYGVKKGGIKYNIAKLRID
jgi:hypothetical protein